MKPLLLACLVLVGLAPLASAQYYPRRYISRPYHPSPVIVPCEPVVEPVVEPLAEPIVLPRRTKMPTGVEWDKVDDHGGRYWINGKPATRQQVYQRLEKALVDDSKYLRVNVISSDKALREKVAAEIESLPETKSKFIVQAYSPDNPLIKGYGFAVDGNPTISISTSTGKELHLQKSWTGVEAFATALRNADPSYDSSKTPDLTKARPNPPGPGPYSPDQPAPGPLGIPLLVWGLAGGAGVGGYLFGGKKK